MNDEFIHVSQFYQTVLAVTVLIFSVLLFVAFCMDLYPYLQEEQLKQYYDEVNWSKKTQQQILQNTVQQKMLEESVNIQIQNQITNMQKVQNQPKLPSAQQHQKQQENSQRKNSKEFDRNDTNPNGQDIPPAENKIQLSQRRKNFVRFVSALNGFISQNLAILMPIIVLGILTKSTYVYSLAAFFCAIFCAVIFDFLRLEQQLKQQYKRGIVIRRLVKILSNLIILSIFLSYWIVIQFNN